MAAVAGGIAINVVHIYIDTVLPPVSSCPSHMTIFVITCARWLREEEK